jgi:lactoylglutathione lyase
MPLPTPNPLRLLAIGLALAGAAHSQDASPAARPRILGVADAAFYVHDVAQTRKFYHDFLGYDEPFSFNNPDGSVRLVMFKINDRQSIEFFPEKAPNTDRFGHVAFETDNAEALRVELKAKGIAVPDKMPISRTGTLHFEVTDPDGHGVEFIQFLPGSWIARDFGHHLPATRFSQHMSHAGIVVRNLDAAVKFYGGVLGFTETWRGSGNGKTLSWVNLRVPDGTDWIEFMLHDRMPTLAHLGTDHHVCLVVPDVVQAGALLGSRPLPAGAKLSTTVVTGKDNKRQIHAYDPDGTRIEIMEPGPVDGQPAPSSPAPPPTWVGGT